MGCEICDSIKDLLLFFDRLLLKFYIFDLSGRSSYGNWLWIINIFIFISGSNFFEMSSSHCCLDGLGVDYFLPSYCILDSDNLGIACIKLVLGGSIFTVGI
jgi:hypothetical protein